MVGALILAGGKGTRMRQDKALMELCGKPLLSYSLERALAFADEVVVALGRNGDLDRYDDVLPRQVVVTRDNFDGKGPLAGIHAGMEAIRSRYAAVLPCDSPFVKEEVVTLLFQEAAGVDAAIPRWPSGYIEPLHAVYKVRPVRRAAREALRLGRLRVDDILPMVDGVRYVTTNRIRRVDPELLTFMNINHRRDLETAAQIVRKAESRCGP